MKDRDREAIARPLPKTPNSAIMAKASIELAFDVAMQKGAKLGIAARCLRWVRSASPMALTAAKVMEGALTGAQVKNPLVPLIANVTAARLLAHSRQRDASTAGASGA
ncbi:hypothetical protein [Sphingomonas sp.]|uniref:hypothetical protein n=1 Tax=Sphingomonas sp. TaxID=28214 RepID=UPI003CC5D465